MMTMVAMMSMMTMMTIDHGDHDDHDGHDDYNGHDDHDDHGDCLGAIKTFLSNIFSTARVCLEERMSVAGRRSSIRLKFLHKNHSLLCRLIWPEVYSLTLWSQLEVSVMYYKLP